MRAGKVDGGLDDVGDVAESELNGMVGFGLFEPCEREDVLDERIEPHGLVSQHPLELFAVLCAEGVVVSEDLDGAEDAGDGCLDFVRDVGDEVAAEGLEFAQFGEQLVLEVAFGREACEALFVIASEKEKSVPLDITLSNLNVAETIAGGK